MIKQGFINQSRSNLKKYLLRGIYEVYNKGPNAESKYEHHLGEKEQTKGTFKLV